MDNWIFLGTVALIVVWMIGIYNSLIALRNEVQSGWTQIDVQLKRRHDLIPNLVSVVKGAVEFEQDTLTQVINARTQAVSAVGPHDKAVSENMLTEAIGKLFAVVESYPQLKSNENIMQLQEELTSTENRIGFSRQSYNDLVASYRTKQQVFPNHLIAGFFGGFAQEEYYEAEETARATPKADISLRPKP